ncbi:hypothetical protein GCM10009559_64320 [Pseudonocardia zijingensis]|uniref:Uncharacterized protein n=1 Tax=Pseudonocardia zijingensis TaxID=153376 RepID=A0ABP3YQB1_9PSEU
MAGIGHLKGPGLDGAAAARWIPYGPHRCAATAVSAGHEGPAIERTQEEGTGPDPRTTENHVTPQRNFAANFR